MMHAKFSLEHGNMYYDDINYVIETLKSHIFSCTKCMFSSNLLNGRMEHVKYYLV